MHVTWREPENIKWENSDTKNHILYFFHMRNVQNRRIQTTKAEVHERLSGASKKGVGVGGKPPLWAEGEVSFQDDKNV